MKRILALLLAMTMALSLAACGSTGSSVSEPVSESDSQAAVRAQAIVDKANQQAREIISGAKETAEEERRRMMENMREDVADAAVEIAGHLLSKEVDLEDNKKLAKQFFEVYKNAEGKSV